MSTGTAQAVAEQDTAILDYLDGLLSEGSTARLKLVHPVAEPDPVEAEHDEFEAHYEDVLDDDMAPMVFSPKSGVKDVPSSASETVRPMPGIPMSEEDDGFPPGMFEGAEMPSETDSGGTAQRRAQAVDTPTDALGALEDDGLPPGMFEGAEMPPEPTRGEAEEAFTQAAMPATDAMTETFVAQEAVAEEAVAEETVAEETVAAPPVVPAMSASEADGPLYLIAKVGPVRVALDATRISAVLPEGEPLLPLRGAPEQVAGAVAALGRRAMVLDLAPVVLGKSLTTAPRVIVLDEGKWALAVSGIEDEQAIADEQVQWREQARQRPWLKGLIRESGLAILDIPELKKMFKPR